MLLDFIKAAAEGFPADVEAGMVAAGVKRPGSWSTSTILARVAHLAAAHRVLGLDSPTTGALVRDRLRALRVSTAGARRQHDPITLSALDQMLATVAGDGMREIRDRGLLLFTWLTGGRRRSEACAARVEDLAADGPDYVLTIPRSKGDQVGEGFDVPLAGRAAHAVRTWLHATGIKSGPVFRSVDRWGNVGDRSMSGQAVIDVVKRCAAAAGLDPARYGAHSLRAGFVMEAGRQGVTLQDAMLMTGHKSVGVAARYHRAGDALNHQAARLAG